MSPGPLTLFGGTFDPIHLGHVHAITQIQQQVETGEILVLPAGEPWQKSDRELTPAHHRLEMCRLAFAGKPQVSISDIEVRRTGPTYTIDTIEEIQRQLDHAGDQRKIQWVIGADALKNLHTWNRYEELISKTRFVVIARPEFPVFVDQVPRGTFKIIEIAALPISSSLVRERIRSGESGADLLPPLVWQYIVEHGLYGAV